MAKVHDGGFWFFSSENVCYRFRFLVDVLDATSLEPYDMVVFVEGSFVEMVVVGVVDKEALPGIFSVSVDSVIPTIPGSFKGLAADGGVDGGGCVNLVFRCCCCSLVGWLVAFLFFLRSGSLLLSGCHV